MSLASEIAAALPVLRIEAEARMTSTCTATTPGVLTEDDWNPATGEYDDPEPVTVYTGKCRLRWQPAPQDADAGETTWAADRSGTLSTPIDAAPLPDGALVTITANPNDPEMVGLELTVLGVHFQTDSTARRYPVQVVTRDA